MEESPSPEWGWHIVGQLAALLLALPIIGLVILWILGERGRIMLPATRQAINEAGWRRFLSPRGLHGYLYSRWPKHYIGLLIHFLFARLGTRGRKWLSDHYHGKVLTPSNARSVVTVNRNIPLTDLEQIIPYPMARKLLLQGPPEIAAFECPCRLTRANPCQPTRVCMIVGQPFVDFVLQHHPAKSQRLTQDEALKMLADEHRRGHVHSAWFKDVCLDRFFAICNCCKCCCGGIDAMVHHGIPMMVSSGYVARPDGSRCKTCGTCGEACPFGAIQIDEGHVTVAWDTCMGCGVCVGQCPNDAIVLARDRRKGEPLDAGLVAGGTSTAR
jgi:NAD-dependent dihydropyrimidine dehydrogenase PreA subunit